MRSSFTTFVVATVAAGLGFVAGRLMPGDTPTPPAHLAVQEETGSRAVRSTDRDTLVAPRPDEARTEEVVPAEALARALSLSNVRARTSSMASVLRRWMRSDPDGAFYHVGSIEDENQRRAAYQMALRIWGKEDPAGAVAAAQSLGYDTRAFIVAALSGFADSDPEGAARTAEQLDPVYPAGGGPSLTSSVIIGWAQRNAAAAADYLEGRSSEFDDNVLQAVAVAYSHRDGEAAMAWLARMRASARSVVEPVVGNFVRSDPTAARAYAESMKQGATRDLLVSKLASALAAADPRDALDWIERFRGEETYQALVSNVLREWSSHDPEGASDYVLTIADSESREEHLALVVQNTAYRDAGLAIELLNHLDPGPRRNEGLAAIAALVAIRDWELAMGLIDDIDDLDQRATARITVATRTYIDDPATARAILTRYGLRDDDRVQALLGQPALTD